jgi:hypothetical protein
VGQVEGLVRPSSSAATTTAVKWSRGREGRRNRLSIGSFSLTFVLLLLLLLLFLLLRG